MDERKERKNRLDWLFESRYKRLRMRAEYVARAYYNLRLHATTLMHESYLKLVKSERLNDLPTGQLENVAGLAMKQVALDWGRRENSQRRGGNAVTVPLDDALGVPGEPLEGVLAVRACLEQVRAMDERKAKAFEYRFLQGLSSRETAERLGVAEATVERDVAFLRAWITWQLTRQT